METNGLSGNLHCIVLLRESGRLQIAQSRLLAHSVVKDLGVSRAFLRGLFAGSEMTVTKQFRLQRTPVAFHQRVVPAVAYATH